MRHTAHATFLILMALVVGCEREDAHKKIPVYTPTTTATIATTSTTTTTELDFRG